MFSKAFTARLVAAAWLFFPVSWAWSSEIRFNTNDVVAFIGGANVVAAQETGHFETLVTAGFPELGLKFRSLAWEADTVFRQSRDLNYPTLAEQLRRLSATVVFVQFGQGEALDRHLNVPEFKNAYSKLLTGFADQKERKIVLVIPPPFEESVGLLPSLADRNAVLGRVAEAIREMGRERGFPVVDLLSAVGKRGRLERLTSDGVHLTPYGQGVVAQVLAQEIGLTESAGRAGALDAAGRWSNPACERLRTEIVMKNRLWFDYSRPMNWAFLAGDRTEQPSSHDHRDYKIRWFPAEMERFVPLIESSERQISEIGKAAAQP